MYVSAWRLFLLISFVIGSFGCSEAVPTVSSLSVFSDAPRIGGTISSTIYVNTSNSAISISGTCEAVAGSFIEMSNDGTTYSALNSPSSGDCSAGTFNLNIPDPATYFNFVAGTNDARVIYLRVNDAGDKTDSHILNVRYDGVPPTGVLTLASNALTNSLPIIYTLAMSEEVEPASLTFTSFSYSGAVNPGLITVSNPSGDKKNFLVRLTGMYSDSPTTTIQLTPAGVVDIHGNYSSVVSAAPANVNYDATAPLVAFTAPAANSLVNNTVNIYANCEGSVLPLAIQGNVVGAPIAAACSSGTLTNFTVDLSAGSGTKTITLSQTDLVGNVGTATLVLNNDETPPTVTVTGGAQSDEPLEFTFTFDEPVADFVAADIAVTNGTFVDFTPMSATVYVAHYTPAGYNVSTTVDVAVGAAHDAAGNANLFGTGAITSTAPSLVTVSAVYAHADWNTYLVNDNPAVPDYLQTTETNCTGAETGLYSACIHGGEKRKVVVNGFTSCVNLTMTDDLGVFNWVCTAASGTATFYSKNINTGKGLRDLVNATSWKTNFITVKLSGTTTVARSNAAAWWTNAVGALPASTSTMVSLSTAAIYTVTSTQTARGYVIANDGIAIVTLPGGTLKYNGVTAAKSCNSYTASVSSPDVNSMFCFNTRKFLWIEADMNGDGGTNDAEAAFTMGTIVFSRLHNSIFKDFGGVTAHAGDTLRFEASRSNYINNLVIDGCGNSAIFLDYSGFNTFKNIKASRCLKNTGSGMISLYASASNRFYDMVLSRDFSDVGGWGAGGVLLDFSDNNIFVRTYISNASSNALYSFGFNVNGSVGNIIDQATITGMEQAAMMFTSSTYNIVSHATFVNNNYGIYFNTSGTLTSNNLFNSIATVNQTTGIFADSSGTQTGAKNNFYNIYASNNTSTFAAENSLTVTTFLSFKNYVATNQNCRTTSGLTANCQGFKVTATSGASAFNPVISTDGINASDTGVTTLFSAISDWTSFESPFRTWGKSLGTWSSLASAGDSSLFGGCASGSCQIGDWRASVGGPIHNVSYNYASNGAFTVGAGCPAAVDGSQFITENGQFFLQHADEVTGDDIGDEDGLCESSEACTYAPNIGSHQGEISLGTCVFNDGTISDVR